MKGRHDTQFPFPRGGKDTPQTLEGPQLDIHKTRKGEVFLENLLPFFCGPLPHPPLRSIPNREDPGKNPLGRTQTLRQTIRPPLEVIHAAFSESGCDGKSCRGVHDADDGHF